MRLFTRKIPIDIILENDDQDRRNSQFLARAKKRLLMEDNEQDEESEEPSRHSMSAVEALMRQAAKFKEANKKKKEAAAAAAEEETEKETPKQSKMQKMQKLLGKKTAEPVEDEEEEEEKPRIDSLDASTTILPDIKTADVDEEHEVETEIASPILIDIDLEKFGETEQTERLVELFKKHGIDLYDSAIRWDEWSQDKIKEYWGNWSQDEIKEYNLLIHELEYESPDLSGVDSFEDVDPYALAQINLNLWPNIAYKGTTVRKRIEQLLHKRNDPNSWACVTFDEGRAVKDEAKYDELKQLYHITRDYYKVHKDKQSQINNVKFWNEYSEYNSVTPTGVKSGMLIGVCKIVAQTDKIAYDVKVDYANKDIWHAISGNYTTVLIDELTGDAEKIKENGKIRYVISREQPNDMKVLFKLEPILTEPAELKALLSFAPRSGRRVVDNEAWTKAQKVGALNNAIVNLFSNRAFLPHNIKANPEAIDWNTVYKLKDPINYYVAQAKQHLLSWEDEELLKFYRMFASVLPSIGRFRNQMEPVLEKLSRIQKLEAIAEKYGIDNPSKPEWLAYELEASYEQTPYSVEDVHNDHDMWKRIDELDEECVKHIGNEEYKAELVAERDRLQELVDNPMSPNKEEWDRNYVNGKESPFKIATLKELPKLATGVDDLYMYEYVGKYPSLRPPFMISTIKTENLENYELVSGEPMKEVIDVGVVGELENISKILGQAQAKMKESYKEAKGPLLSLLKRKMANFEQMFAKHNRSLSDLAMSGDVNYTSWDEESQRKYVKLTDHFGGYAKPTGGAAEEEPEAEPEEKKIIKPNLAEEGFVTTPSVILVNGTPFKLRVGDRLIIDNVSADNSQQK